MIDAYATIANQTGQCARSQSPHTRTAIASRQYTYDPGSSTSYTIIQAFFTTQPIGRMLPKLAPRSTPSPPAKRTRWTDTTTVAVVRFRSHNANAAGLFDLFADRNNTGESLPVYIAQ